MKTVKLLWRPFSVFFRRDFRLIPFVNTFPSSNPSLFLLSSSSSLHTHDFNLATKFPHIGCPNQLSKLFFSNSLLNHNKLRTCWNCQSSSTTSDIFLVCNSCHCIQPVDSTIDYFQIFGLERKYEIEESSLEGMYKSWQKKLHPDLVHSKSESEREYAAEQSARIIDAYRTLKNSLSRAMYLMKLQGVPVDEEKTVSDPELLAEVMEIRESVEEAPDSQALKQIQAEVQEKMKQWSETFSGAFKSQKTEEALNAIRRMTYYKRANEEIEKRL